jgi:hypothetical protein
MTYDGKFSKNSGIIASCKTYELCIREVAAVFKKQGITLQVTSSSPKARFKMLLREMKKSLEKKRRSQAT